MVARPRSSDIVRSVHAGLGIRGDLSPAVVPTVHFEPTIGIVAGKINTLAANVESFHEPLTMAIEKVVIPSIRKNFDVGGRPKWAPLAKYTINIRGSASPILRRSGDLESAATSLQVWDISNKSAVLRDLPVWYGKVQQAGYEGRGFDNLVKALNGDMEAATAATYKNPNAAMAIPARPFIMLQEEDKTEIYAVFIEWLDLKVREAMAGM
jgi:phage gpG-like protein